LSAMFPSKLESDCGAPPRAVSLNSHFNIHYFACKASRCRIVSQSERHHPLRLL
jgi:hypothetical protein